MIQKYLYHGEWYTVGMLAELSNLPYHTVWKRIKRGWSAEKAISEPSCHKPHQQHTAIIGSKELSAKEVAEMKGVTLANLYQQIHRGKTLQQIVDEEIEE
jgi:hypothetical protein